MVFVCDRVKEIGITLQIKWLCSSLKIHVEEWLHEENFFFIDDKILFV